MTAKPSNVVALVLGALLIAAIVGVSHAQRGRQTVPSDSAPATPSDRAFADNEVQVWQGRVVRVVGNDLVVKVEGEHERFELANDVKIQKDRKKVELESLIRGDFARLRTMGHNGKEVAISVQAFSLR